MESETPQENNTAGTDTTETVTEKLANEAAANSNGNGNGNGHHSAEPAAETSGTKKEETFSMFDDLKKETEEDKKREEKKNDPGSAKEKNPFDDFDPKNDVTEEDLSQENVTLAEANAAVSLYLATLDFFTSFTCCAIRDDFSIAAQLKYRIHPWRKKAIQIPWVRLKMQPSRRSKPGWALAGALIAGTLPTIGLAFIDNYHDRKMHNDPNYKDRTAGSEKEPGTKGYKVYVDPRGAENPGFGGKKQYGETVVDVDYEEVKTEDTGEESQEEKERKRGRHAKTCPKHMDKENGVCNCK